MGAWALGLFCSDIDYDLIGDLGHEAGLDKLEEEAVAKAEAKKKKKHGKKNVTKGKSENKKEDDVADVYYSLFANHCSDVETVREYLESSGALDRLISEYTAKALSLQAKKEFIHPGYQLVLLGACAMTLGCTLKDEFLETLRQIFTEVGLMRDALKEVDTALNGPGAFESGKCYIWGSLGIHEPVKNPDGDLIHKPVPGRMRMLNVPAPFGFHAGPNTTALVKKIKARMAAKKGERPLNVCGGCGASQGKDGVLLVCVKCKTRRYCSRDCQKEHWQAHKLICVEPGAAAAEVE